MWSEVSKTDSEIHKSQSPLVEQVIKNIISCLLQRRKWFLFYYTFFV